MNKEIKAKWLEALRSGKYKQGQAALNRNGEFCCLGILCDVMEVPEMGVSDAVEGAIVYGIGNDYSVAFLPDYVADEAGLEPTGLIKREDFYNDDICLADLNDKGSTFEEIADIIEKYL